MYQPKVYRRQGSNDLVVASGGKIIIQTGGQIVPNSETQPGPNADLSHAVGTADGTVADVGGAFNQTTLNDNFKECSSRINTILGILRNAGLSS